MTTTTDAMLEVERATTIEAPLVDVVRNLDTGFLELDPSRPQKVIQIDDSLDEGGPAVQSIVVYDPLGIPSYGLPPEVPEPTAIEYEVVFWVDTDTSSASAGAHVVRAKIAQ